jgi:hypothetical protein
MKLVQPLPESVVENLAQQAGPNSAAAKVLAEGAEIKARGSQVRYWLTDEPGLCCQEGVAFTSTSEQ